MLNASVLTHKPNRQILCGLSFLFCAALLAAQTGHTPPKIFAQKLVTETLATHPELTGVEISSTPPGKSQCVTIASTEIKGIGEKCAHRCARGTKMNSPP